MVVGGRYLYQNMRPASKDNRNSETLVELQSLAGDIAKLRELRDQIISGRHAFYKASSAVSTSISPVETPATTLLDRIAQDDPPHKDGDSRSITQATSVEQPPSRKLSSRLAYNDKLEPFHHAHIEGNGNGTDKARSRARRRSRSPYRSASVEDDDDWRYGRLPSTAPPFPKRAFHDGHTERSAESYERRPPCTISILKGRLQPPSEPNVRKAHRSQSPEWQNRQDKFAKQRRSPSPSRISAPPINGDASCAADHRSEALPYRDSREMRSSSYASPAVTIRGPSGISVRVSQDNTGSQPPSMKTAFSGSNALHSPAYAAQLEADSTLPAVDTHWPDASVENISSRSYEKQESTSSAPSSTTTGNWSFLEALESTAQGMSPWSLQGNLARNAFHTDETNISIIPTSAPSAAFPSSDRLTGRDGSSSAPVSQYQTNGSWLPQACDPQVWPARPEIPFSWQQNSFGQTFSGTSFQQTSHPYAPVRQSVSFNNGGLPQQQPWPPASMYAQYYTQDPQAGFNGSY